MGNPGLLDQVRANDRPCAIEPPQGSLWLKVLAEVGEGVADGFRETAQILTLVGAVVTTFARGLRSPRARPRWCITWKRRD